MAKLIKLAKMAGVMHEADHAYSIRSHCFDLSALSKLLGQIFNKI